MVAWTVRPAGGCEHAAWISSANPIQADARERRRLRGPWREQYPEGRTAALAILDPRVAAVQLRELRHQREADAHPTPVRRRALALLERFEDRLPEPGAHP